MTVVHIRRWFVLALALLMLVWTIQAAMAVGLADGVVVDWKCNGNFSDSSSNGLDLISQNGAVVDGSGCHTNGVDNYITAPNDSRLEFDETTNYSIFFTFNTTDSTFSDNGENRLLHDQNEATALGWYFEMFTDPRFRFNSYDGTMGNIDVGQVLYDGQPHDVGIVQNAENNNLTLYIGGVAVGSITTNGGSFKNNNYPITFGQRSSGYSANTYRDVVVYGRALNGSEVTQLRAQNYDPYYVAVVDEVNVKECGNYSDSMNTIYKLTSDITDSSGATVTGWNSQTACLHFENPKNVTVDCQGHSIVRTDAQVGISMSIVDEGGTNSSVQNCFVNASSSGTTMGGIVIFSNWQYIGDYQFINNTVILSGLDGEGIYAYDALAGTGGVGTVYGNTVIGDETAWYIDLESYGYVNVFNNTVSGKGYVLGIYTRSADVFGNVLNSAGIDGAYTGAVAVRGNAAHCVDGDGCKMYNNTLNVTGNYLKVGSGDGIVSMNSSTIGNMYLDSSGTGFSETCTDANSDGICDATYDVDGSGFIDYLPKAMVVGQNAGPVCTQEALCELNVTDCMVMDQANTTYVVQNDIHDEIGPHTLESVGSACLVINASDVTFDGNGKLLTIQDDADTDMIWFEPGVTNAVLKNFTGIAYNGSWVEFIAGNGVIFDGGQLTIQDVQIEIMTPGSTPFDIPYSGAFDSNANISFERVVFNGSGSQYIPVPYLSSRWTIVDSRIECPDVNYPGGWCLQGYGNLTIRNSYLSAADNMHLIATGPASFANVLLVNNTLNASLYVDESPQNSVMVLNDSVIGNAWVNATGDGFSQTCTDANDDEICDSSYDVMGTGYVDYLPIAMLAEEALPDVEYTQYNGATTNFSAGAESLTNPVLENTTTGKIVWSGSGLNFSLADFDQYVHIGSGYVSIDSANLPADVNGSAQLTLYNLNGLVNPKIFVDGRLCTDCGNFTYNGTDAVFDVVHFTNYTVQNVTGCLNITVPGEYTLTQNITDAPNGQYCFNVSANNVILDWNGYDVYGSGNALGVLVSRSVEETTNVTVKNGIMSGYNTNAIATFENADGNVIENINMTGNQFYGINSISFTDSNNNLVRKMGMNGFVVSGSNNITVEDSMLCTYGYYGISLSGSTNVTIRNNTEIGCAVADSFQFIKGFGYNYDVLIEGNDFSVSPKNGAFFRGDPNYPDQRYIVRNNIISSNGGFALYYYDTGFKIYNNWLSGGVEGVAGIDDPTKASLNVSRQSGVRVAGITGDEIGGNFYASYPCNDTDHDGFCDQAKEYDPLPLSNNTWWQLVNMNACRLLNSSNTRYVLTQNVTSDYNTACFQGTGATNITVDCQGLTVTSGGYTFGSSGAFKQLSHIYAKNCVVTGFPIVGEQISHSVFDNFTMSGDNAIIGAEQGGQWSYNVTLQNSRTISPVGKIFDGGAAGPLYLFNNTLDATGGYVIKSHTSPVVMVMQNNNISASIFAMDLWNNPTVVVDASGSYNNIFNVANVDNVTGTMNTSLQTGTNIIGGPKLGGNFWTNPTQTGYSDNCIDMMRDQICDAPFLGDSLPLRYLRSLTGAPNVTYPLNNSANRGLNVNATLGSQDVYEQDYAYMVPLVESVLNVTDVNTGDFHSQSVWGVGQSFVATEEFVDGIGMPFWTASGASGFNWYLISGNGGNGSVMASGFLSSACLSTNICSVPYVKVTPGQTYTLIFDSFPYKACGGCQPITTFDFSPDPYPNGTMWYPGVNSSDVSGYVEIVGNDVPLKVQYAHIDVFTGLSHVVVGNSTGNHTVVIGSGDVSGQGNSTWLSIPVRVSNLGVVSGATTDKSVYWTVQEQPVVSFNVTSFDGYVTPTVRIDAMNGSSVVASQNVSDTVNLSQVHTFVQLVVESYENATFRVVVNDTLFEEIASVNNVVLDALSQPVVTSPNTTKKRPFNVSWSEATQNLGAVSYALGISYDNGSSWSDVASVAASPYLFTPVAESQQVRFRVNATDSYVATNQGVGPMFAINMSPELYDELCAALTYPHEDDLPAAANVPVNFSVYAPFGFSSPVVSVVLKSGGTNVTGVCGYAQIDNKTRDYSCNVSMRYFYPADSYDLNISYVDGNVSEGYVASNECGYGQLIAHKMSVSAVSFPGAAPGVQNVQSTPAIVLRNTGNAPLTFGVTAYDLAGQSTPSSPLQASYFKMGSAQNASVWMVNGVEVNLSGSLVNAEGSSKNEYLWLSMPQSAIIQSYVATTPWQLTSTG